MRLAESKIIGIDEVAQIRAELSKQEKSLVATNGCFDLLHVGHVQYLQEARSMGDVLLVGLNSDASVQKLKGDNRPVNQENYRALLVASLEAVDYVCIFQEIDAINFLTMARPDVYVKGGNYSLQTLNPRERSLIESMGGKIICTKFSYDISSTQIMKKINSE